MTVESIGPIPESLPAPLLNPHQFVRFDVAESDPREHGDIRRRARFTTVAQRATVQWLFEQDDYNAFSAWYEDAISVGESAFDVRLLTQGEAGRTRTFSGAWWVAQFVAPYQVEIVNRGGRERLMYRINAELLLHGAPSVTRTVPALRASGRLTHFGSAVFAEAPFYANGSVTHDGSADFYDAEI